MADQTIYHSEHPAPPLPRQSIFSFLFPEAPVAQPTTNTTTRPPSRRKIAANCPTQVDPLTSPPRVLDRGQVLSHALKLAAGLRDQHKGAGLNRGDVVGLVGLNSLEWLNAMYGSWAAGLRVSPVNWAYTPPELLHQLSHSAVSLIFISPSLLPTLQETLSLGKLKGFEIPQSRVILLCTKEAKMADVKVKEAGYSCIEEIWGEKEWVHEGLKEGEEHETCLMCYSSGTTGVAKGVETTHYNLTSQLSAITSPTAPAHSYYPKLSSTVPAAFSPSSSAGTSLSTPSASSTSNRLVPGDITLGYLPFSHMYGLTLLVLETLVSGIPMVVLPRFDEKQVLQCVQDWKVTWMLVVPPVLITLANSKVLDQYDTSSLKGVMSAAAPLSADLCARVEGRMKGLVITQGYGLTETSPMTHILPLASAHGRQSSIGKLIPSVSARLIDPETGKDIPANSGLPGELWMKGPNVMKGYFKNPDATRNTFDETGEWFKSGDQARRDEEGYYYIEDRLKELIKYKGLQVAPAELEALLLTHSEVADCAVIGVYVEEQATELPRAYVVPLKLPPGASHEQKAAFSKKIEEWVKERVANHKRLRGGVVLVETIPKSPSGKILRKDLRAALKTEMERDKADKKGKAKL